MSRLSPTLRLALAILIPLALSLVARTTMERRLALEDLPGWVTTDADSLYHMRRVDRALVNDFHVAGSDEFLNYPEGSAIPWPPYYTHVALALLAPLAPEETQARRAFVEEGVASLALLFGVLTTLVACLAGWFLVGRLGALLAGSYHALTHISIVYSNLGNGDHHSFVSFLSGALLLLISWTILRGHLKQKRAALYCGVAGGLLLGLLLGSWLGAMVLVVALELTFALLILRQAKHPLAGLATFGFSLHATALLTLLPAVLASPWTDQEPWMVVNLSYFHPAFLAVAGAVFVPLFWLKQGSRALGRYPWIVALVLITAGTIAATTDLAIAASLRDGFAWASKTNRFMAGIRESRSLFALDASPGATYEVGLGLWLIPLLIGAAWFLRRREQLLCLLPWLIYGELVWLQATQQARFAESLALPVAVLFAWTVTTLVQGELRLGFLKRFSQGVLVAGSIGLVLLSHGGTLATLFERMTAGARPIQAQEIPSRRATRRLVHWISGNTPDSGDYCVLADWSLGHTIEWGANRPSVATNFGSYVGEDSFRDPARFFMSEDPMQAEELLHRRRARYVMLDSSLPDHLNSMVERAAPESRERWIQAGTAGRVTQTWFQTMGARLMFDGTVFQGTPAPQLDFLRLVYVSPVSDPGRRLRGPQDVSPGAWLWEHVEGAKVECAGQPGDQLEVVIELTYPPSNRPLRWVGRATADADGLARLRVPYATTAWNGQGRVSAAQWKMGSHGGTLRIEEPAVQDGLVLVLSE